jgi:DNA (cytosine-5)-methyltransferase 1
MDRLRHGGLFEGFGGTTLAAEMVLGELDTRWVSDIKPAAVRLLEQRQPDAPNLGDMRFIHGGRVEQVDVLTFSWPCQPHSVAGRRLGAADPRALWPYVARIIRSARPAVLLGENVARIATSGELSRVLADLRAMGYAVAWRVQRADLLGVCHRRARCFLVAVDPYQPAALARARLALAPVWPEPVTGPDVPLLKAPTAQLATNGGSQHPDKRKAGGHGPTLADEVEWLLPTPLSRDARSGAVPAEVIGRVYPSGRVRTLGSLALPDVVALLPTPTARAHKTPDPRGPRPEAKSPGMTLETAIDRLDGPGRFGRYAPAIARHELLIGRPAPEPTMPGRDGNRTLSPHFVEWMMCLPEGHVCGLDDLGQPRPAGWRSRALSLLGDGVVPLQGAAVYGPLLSELLPVG